MTPADYIDYAKTFGYDIRFTGIGMAYVTIGDVLLTEAMDTEKAERELAFIGMAIMADTLHAKNW
jgi:hypothetical protein